MQRLDACLKEMLGVIHLLVKNTSN
ncbi:protein of unknown function [Xenorhabdus doucetiae]|uniref:Uncharacterized protein n=1 Tax=Xenorhabdus doucetiae TaxID=351671 RepID=A0A068QMM5_9GAMM|nr:protein of unknown function [Xenorhabdus doucetiae]